MAGLYPSVNDRDWNLLNKICQNTAGIADLEAGDVASIVAGSGISISPAGGTGVVTITNSGVRSVTGTANQITASPTTGAVILTIPAIFIAPGTIASTTTIQAGSSFIGLNSQTITGNASGAWAITANGTNQSITLTPSGTGNVSVGTATNQGINFTTSAADNFISGTDNSTTFLRAGTANNGGFINVTGGSAGTPNLIRFGRTSTESARFAASGNLLLGGLTTDGTGVLQLPTSTTTAGGISFGAGDTIWSRTGAGGMRQTSSGVTTSFQFITTNNAGAGFTQSFDGSNNWTFNNSENATMVFKTNNTTALTLTAAQNASFAGDVSITTGALLTVTNLGTNAGGASLSIRSGTNTVALTLDSLQNATFAGAIIGGVQALSGAGAVNVTQLTTAFTSTGGAQALTLANGSNGQLKTIAHVVDGGSGVLTPTTKTGYTTITFTNAGDAVTLQYFTTQGWIIVGIFGAVAA